MIAFILFIIGRVGVGTVIISGVALAYLAHQLKTGELER